jgi:hypothetical protein
MKKIATNRYRFPPLGCSGTREASCVTDLLFWDVFGHARGILRYRFALLSRFRARERHLALPICSFGTFSGTREASCVTDLLFWDVFGHARGILRYRFGLLGRFRARERHLVLPICFFGTFSGTREASCVTDSLFWDVFEHARTSCEKVFTFLIHFTFASPICKHDFHFIDPLSRLRELHYYPLKSYRFLAIQTLHSNNYHLVTSPLMLRNQHWTLTEPYIKK